MTLTVPPRWSDDLIELLDQQHRIYLHLHELSVRQGQLVAAGDAEPLLTLLAQRQTLIDQLTQLNGRLEPFKSQWPHLWHQLDTTTRARVQGFIDEVQDLLDRIVEQDEKDRQALSAHRGRIADDLRNVSRGDAVNRAYGRQNVDPQTNNRYTDREG
jgi:hypothetical protein